MYIDVYKCTVGKMKKKVPNFEIDTSAVSDFIEICWICKHRAKCPINWECETIENLDNDDTDIGDGEA